MYVSRNCKTQILTITSGTTSSTGIIDLRDAVFVGLVIPTTTLASTSLTFQVSSTNGGTFYPLYVGGSELSVAASTNRAIDIGASRAALVPWQYMKISCNTAETTTVTIQVHTK